MTRREFVRLGMAASAVELAGCVGFGRGGMGGALEAGEGAMRYHVFSKMFQSPVTASPEALCELMAAAGFDGIQWTVRPKGHVEPARVAAELPRVCKIAASFGLKNETICTKVGPDDPDAETIFRTAADCGIAQARVNYFFYDTKKETFVQSMERIRRGFADLAGLSERTGVKAVYQNHSSWGPSVFGGVIWDVHECVRNLDPATIGVEYDPMHALYETNLSWTHGFDLIAPWIAAIDLKDFHYQPDPKDARKTKKAMVAAGSGIVPWKTVRELRTRHQLRVPYIVHFEYAFDKSNLKKTVKNELDAFKQVLG